MGEIYLGLFLILSGLGVVAVYVYLYFAVKKKDRQEREYWQAYQKELSVRRAAHGRMWAEEDIRAIQEGRRPQRIPAGAPSAATHAYESRMQQALIDGEI